MSSQWTSLKSNLITHYRTDLEADSTSIAKEDYSNMRNSAAKKPGESK